MSDPKEEQQSEEQLAEDLTVPDAQAEGVGGGEVSLNYASVKQTYIPQKP